MEHDGVGAFEWLLIGLATIGVATIGVVWAGAVLGLAVSGTPHGVPFLVAAGAVPRLVHHLAPAPLRRGLSRSVTCFSRGAALLGVHRRSSCRDWVRSGVERGGWADRRWARRQASSVGRGRSSAVRSESRFAVGVGGPTGGGPVRDRTVRSAFVRDGGAAGFPRAWRSRTDRSHCVSSRLGRSRVGVVIVVRWRWSRSVAVGQDHRSNHV